MTQEDKDLLLKDLCTRLPYGVEVQYKGNRYNLTEMHKDGRTYLGSYNSIYGDWHCSLEFEDYPKPYLRPMSSMTEEEKRELARITNSLIGYDEDSETLESVDFYGDARLDVGMEIWMKTFDWLNKKRFAYRTIDDDRDMFELGLAFPAPAGMYDNEQNK